MKFNLDGIDMVLKGLVSLENEVVDVKVIAKELKNISKIVIVLHIYFTTMNNSSSNLLPFSNSNLANYKPREIMQNCKEIFQPPKRLLPHKSHDHNTPLESHSKPICLRPYMYPYYEKNETDKMVAEMSDSRVIRPSQNPFYL